MIWFLSALEASVFSVQNTNTHGDKRLDWRIEDSVFSVEITKPTWFQKVNWNCPSWWSYFWLRGPQQSLFCNSYVFKSFSTSFNIFSLTYSSSEFAFDQHCNVVVRHASRHISFDASQAFRNCSIIYIFWTKVVL